MATGGGLGETDESKPLARGLAGPASRLGEKVRPEGVGGKVLKPWEAAGVSRRTWFRRKKAGAL